MKSFKIRNRSAQLIIMALSLISITALAGTHWYCVEGSVCGTNQEADIGNGCLAIVCPKKETCTSQDGDDNNCTPGSATAQCEGWQSNGEMGQCELPAKDAGPEPGGTACTQCTIN